ncbi:methyltransferase domain-containing protein [Streptomyces sp. SID13666]|uniref:methyltransferase n=1 Tax=unclassified Streptomyces TaxID=2593676 RepID=UPI0013BFBA28|nr:MULTISPECIES: methyltransferase [unclassified Streptomyces]NEA55104.1 methyltransferase domain-containing protein [Streptomyces sp. SID13666]NEA71111.1 methyltransferase domain-containing protein [Streptomyces sp. SID13588]
MTLPGPVTDPFDVMFVGWSFFRSKLLTAALDLEVFSVLGDRSLSAEELCDRTGLHPRGGRDFLDALAAIGLLVRADDGYRNSPGTLRHLLPDREGYVGGFLRMTTELMGSDQGSLTRLLRDGTARNQGADGEVPFTKIFNDRARLRQFLSAMDSFSGAVAEELAHVFDWSRYATFSDVGGARGNLAAHLAAAHPGLTGTVLDRPSMAEHFDQLVAERGVEERLRFVGADFFTADLPRADVVILGGVLHDWPMEQRATLLRKAYDAVQDGGVVIVYDTMLDDERQQADPLMLSLIMMLQSAQAAGFSPAECGSWMTEAGFIVERVVRLPALTTAVIGRKN